MLKLSCLLMPRCLIIAFRYGMVSHMDMGVVHCGEAEIGIDAVSEMNMSTAPAGMKGRLHINASYTRESLASSFSTSPLSPSMQMDRALICSGQTASL